MKKDLTVKIEKEDLDIIKRLWLIKNIGKLKNGGCPLCKTHISKLGCMNCPFETYSTASLFGCMNWIKKISPTFVKYFDVLCSAVVIYKKNINKKEANMVFKNFKKEAKKYIKETKEDVIRI